jgi:serine O-acetyltransferase
MEKLKKLKDELNKEIESVKARDPAAKTTFEILTLYPGLRAVASHRVAHWFYTHDMEYAARAISQHSAKVTGIEIHPGAKIGKRFFIDHGHGIVIGETSEIGDDVTMYQNATLGGTGKDTGKRHPTVGSNVMIGAGAKILGPVKIGDNTKIAAGSVVLKDIPSNSTAVGVPAKVVKLDGVRIDYMNQNDIPDPVWNEIERLSTEIKELNKKVDKLEKRNAELEKQNNKR